MYIPSIVISFGIPDFTVGIYTERPHARRPILPCGPQLCSPLGAALLPAHHFCTPWAPISDVELKGERRAPGVGALGGGEVRFRLRRSELVLPTCCEARPRKLSYTSGGEASSWQARAPSDLECMAAKSVHVGASARWSPRWRSMWRRSRCTAERRSGRTEAGDPKLAKAEQGHGGAYGVGASTGERCPCS